MLAHIADVTTPEVVRAREACQMAEFEPEFFSFPNCNLL